MDFSQIKIYDPYKGYSDTLKKTKPKYKTATIAGKWHDEYYQYIEENNIEALTFNYSHGWVQDDFSFLKNLKRVKWLSILTYEVKNLSAVVFMDSLMHLHLDLRNSLKETLNFSQIKKLKDLAIVDYNHRYKDLFNCEKLEILEIYGSTTINSELFCNLKNLRELELDAVKIDAIDFLQYMPNLHKLMLINLRKVTDFTIIGNLTALTWLAIDGCTKLNSIEFVSHLKNLENLNLSSNKEIDSLAPIKDLTRLKDIWLVNSTVIKDGNLHYLQGLPELWRLKLNNKRFYTHKVVQTEWVDEGVPCFSLVKRC